VGVAENPTDNGQDLGSVLGDVLREGERLLGQQVDLLKSELRQELGRAAGAALSLGAGTGLLTCGGVLGTLAVVHGLHRATRLPLWTCYGLVAGLSAAAGAGLLAIGRGQLAALAPGLPQSAATLRENLQWLKEQVTAPAR
jgi:hypothetical protein